MTKIKHAPTGGLLDKNASDAYCGITAQNLVMAQNENLALSGCKARKHYVPHVTLDNDCCKTNEFGYTEFYVQNMRQVINKNKFFSPRNIIVHYRTMHEDVYCTSKRMNSQSFSDEMLQVSIIGVRFKLIKWRA